MTEDSLRCSVGELMAIFRDALVAVIPTADRLLLEWRDDYQHRDWERIAEALFDACVRGPIESDAERRQGEFRLPRYDIDTPSYAELSWINVGSQSSTAPQVVVRLMTDRTPFDVVQVATLDPLTFAPVERLLLPFEETEFAFVRRSESKPDREVRRIEAVD